MVIIMDYRYLATTIIALFYLSGWTDVGEVMADQNAGPTQMQRIINLMNAATAENCWALETRDLELTEGVVRRRPKFHEESNSFSYHNSSLLLHLHKTALSRALYYSFIYQRLNHSSNFIYEPNIMQLYMASTAHVSANPGWTDGSALWFDNNSTYPNWMMRTVSFNTTLQLFGIRAWSGDDKFDTNLLREPMDKAPDGHVLVDSREKNYTDSYFKFCPYTRHNDWSRFWWPDNKNYQDSLRKNIYTVGVKTSPSTGKFDSGAFEDVRFFGPAQVYMSSREEIVPVLMTEPYFDCGRSNRWIVSMTSPVVNFMPRYIGWTFLQRPRFVAIAGMDIEFEKLDINPCPLSESNPPPNFFADTAKCRDTTVCEPVSHRRGGYQCVCKAGLYYPWEQSGPFQSDAIEQATEEQYNSGAFDCVTADELRHFRGNVSAYIDRSESYETLDTNKWSDAQSVFDMVSEVTRANCLLKASSKFHLSRETGYGEFRQFEAQGRTALRISHYLSNFLQNVYDLVSILMANGEYQDVSRFPQYTLEGLSETHIYGEVISAMMSDDKLASIGVFFDSAMFYSAKKQTKEMFGPFAYREETGEVRAIDFAGFSSKYIDKDWFREAKGHGEAIIDNIGNFNDIPTYISSAKITFKAPQYEDGEWVGPTFKCDGMVRDWVLTYRVPFYGLDSTDAALEFKGVVAVDVSLADLDINQCPTEGDVNKIFGNTAKCHYETQHCVPLSGRGFRFGSYQCVCRHGYKHPFSSMAWFDGETMEQEYEKKQDGQSNRYDELRCNEIVVEPIRTFDPNLGGGTVPTTGGGTSGAEPVPRSLSLMVMTLLLHHLYNHRGVS